MLVKEEEIKRIRNPYILVDKTKLNEISSIIFGEIGNVVINKNRIIEY